MNNLILGLKFVFSYFSILPMRSKKEDDFSSKEVLKYTIFFLPFVGFVLGLLTVAIYSILDSIPILGAIIASCIYFVFYGFIHTEAVIDVVDAIYAKHSGKDAYKIIKEPTVGAIGVLYSTVFVVLKLSLFTYLLMNEHFLEFLAIVILSRVTIQFSIYFFTFKSSFVSKMSDAFSLRSFIVSTILYSFCVLFLTDFYILSTAVFAFLFAYLISIFLKRTLGFLNGDTLGFILESVEIFLAMVICFIWL